MNPLDAAYILGAAASAPVWARKARGDWSARLGFDRASPRAVDGSRFELSVRSNRPRVMLHAVSVGETNALRTLVPVLAEHADVIVTSTTDTGLACAKQVFGDSAEIHRFPFDFSWAMGRILDRIRPDVVGLVELELWPNFLASCRRRGIPVAIVNGRLSERSFVRYHRFRSVVGGLFESVHGVAAQDETYARRFRAMGSPGVVVTGSMKWDAVNLDDVDEQAEQLAEALGIDRSKPLIVAGSTGPREEKLLHEACPPGAQLLCAPRKPERFDGAALELEPCVRRSRPADAPSGATRFLLDSIGELRAAYALADLVVVGRSFFDLFGSDPIEPVALSKATIIGPRIGDFESMVGALESCNGIARSSSETIAADLARLLRDKDARHALGQRGRACVEAQRGSSVAHAELLVSLASTRRVSRRT